MEDKLIEFKTAKLAKEVGFDYQTYYFFNGEKLEFDPNITDFNLNYWEVEDMPEFISAPTQTLLQSWIRITHGIAVFPTLDSELNWIYKIVSLKPCSIFEGTIVSEHSYGSEYETCLEEGLFEALLMIKNNLPT